MNIWKYWFNFDMKLADNVSIKKNIFKMHSIWHYTSLRLAKMYWGWVGGKGFVGIVKCLMLVINKYGAILTKFENVGR